MFLKGAVEKVLERCSTEADAAGEPVALTPAPSTRGWTR